MGLKECYQAMGADYEAVIGRLRSERIVQKFTLKFLQDPSYDLLIKSLAEGNGEEAFRAAHTIKGVCQNLSFTRLYASSSRLTEALRGGLSADAAPLAEQVTKDYQETIAAIKALQAEAEGSA